MTLRVLVADDDPVSRLAMEDLLRGVQGAVPTMVEDGASAWETLRTAGPFDLVCLDVRMPAPDGLELATRIRHTPGYQRLPVMLITSTADRQTVLSASRLRLEGFVVKPVNDDTAARIAQVLAQLDDSVLEPPARTLARLRIDAERHGRYLAAFSQQLHALADLAARDDPAFPARAEAGRSAALTLGAPRLEQLVEDARLAASDRQPGAAAAMAQACYWLDRVVAARARRTA